MGPSNANAGRGEFFRQTMKSPKVVTALVIAAAVALLAGAYWAGAAGALAAPLVVVAVIAAIVWKLSDMRAEARFWDHVAQSLGYQPFDDATAMETTTPLLHAGDRRDWKHELMGPLGDSGLTARLAQYRYEIRNEDSKREETWTSHEFTICLVELAESMALFRGLYLREKRGLLGGLGGNDWLRGRNLHDVELESTEFNKLYELQAVREQDEGRLRELFDPKTIVWLTDHPMRPHVELRNGFLVVYVPGWIEDLGRVVWLLEAAEKIAERVQAEVGEAAPTVG